MFNVDTGKRCNALEYQADLPGLLQGLLSYNFDMIYFMIHVLYVWIHSKVDKIDCKKL